MSKFFHSVKPPLLTHFLVFIVNRVKKADFCGEPKTSQQIGKTVLQLGWRQLVRRRMCQRASIFRGSCFRCQHKSRANDPRRLDFEFYCRRFPPLSNLFWNFKEISIGTQNLRPNGEPKHISDACLQQRKPFQFQPGKISVFPGKANLWESLITHLTSYKSEILNYRWTSHYIYTLLCVGVVY